jgi:putative tributyrin esterase
MNAGKRRILGQFLWMFLALAVPFSAFGQETNQNPVLNRKPEVNFKENVVTHRLESKLMGREMPYNVILPPAYKGEKQKRYSVVYLLHGLSGHFDNWTEKTKLAEYASRYYYIIVTPEGGDGWYTNSGSESKDRYESYITEELIPEIDKKFRTLSDRKNRFIAGLSMGGYGSIKFGLKHAEMFALVGSFSGALGAADWTEKEIGTKGAIAESILKVYGAAGSATRKENDIFQMIRDIPAEKIKDLPFIYLDCGTEDFLIQNNQDFAKLLREKKIPHEFRELPGKHNWVYWDAQVQEFLRLSEKFLK